MKTAEIITEDEYNQEWRMLCSIVGPNRPCSTNDITRGLRMPEYERRLVISAAKVAGITSNEIIIDDDNLTMRPVAD